MEVMYVLLPVALLFAAGAVVVFLWAALSGQYDDLDTPPVRMLHDDADEGYAGGERTERTRRRHTT